MVGTLVSRYVPVAFVLAMVSLIPVERAAAQYTATLTGTVSNPAGAPEGGIQVIARDISSGYVRRTTSHTNGFYILSGLQPSTYDITVQSIQFQIQPERITLQTSDNRELNISLKERAATLSTVTTTAPHTVEVRTAEVGTVVSTTQIDSLPQNTRNFLDFALLAPGIKRSTNNGAGIVANGLPAEDLNLFIDGTSYKSDILPGGLAGQDPSVGTTTNTQQRGNPFPQGAVQEFRVITQNYKAEYQKAGSAVITATTKSGGNTFDGTAFYLGQGKTWVQRNFFQTKSPGSPLPDYSRNQFGATFGGPIIQDKIHFFVSYEGDYQNRANDVSPQRNNGQPLPGTPAVLLRDTGFFAAPFHQNLGFAKIDWEATERQTLELTFNARADNDLRDFGIDNGNSTYQGRDVLDNSVYVLALHHRYAADPIVNEFQVSFLRSEWQQHPQDSTGVVQNYIGFGQTGPFGGHQDFVQNKYAIRNDLTYTVGHHVFKTGADVEYNRYDVNKSLNYIPSFFYFLGDTGQGGGGNSSPYAANVGIGNPHFNASNTEAGVYVQDDWSITRKLVLNLGVRWDVETNMIDNSFVTTPAQATALRSFATAHPGFFDPNAYITNGSQRNVFLGQFQPRIGLSYDVFGDAKTVLFAGSGIYYDRDNYNLLLDEKYNTQYLVETFYFSPNGGNPNSSPDTLKWDPRLLSKRALDSLAAIGQGVNDIFAIRNNTKPPFAWTGSGGIRQAVGPVLVSGSYAWSRGYNQFNWIPGNRDSSGNFLSVPGKFGNILLSDDHGRSRYQAFLLSLNKPFNPGRRWGGWSAGLSYTLSWTEVNRITEDPFSFDYSSFHAFRWHPAHDDQRNRIVANGVFGLPFDIALSSIVTLGSSTPFNITTGCQAPKAVATDTFCINRGWYGNGQPTGFQFPTGQRAENGRQPCHAFVIGCWAYRQVDLRLQKNVDFLRQQVGVSIDAINIFNYHNFQYNDIQIPHTGTLNINSARDPNNIFDPREYQIGVHYAF
jgi:hypothetical protein